MDKNLLENCLKIISVWEGNTLYAHGNGAVGLIGFQFSWREQLNAMMGLPAQASDEMFNAAVDRHKGKALEYQTELGVKVLREIYDFSCTPRGLTEFMSVLNVLDIGVNNGRQNSFLTTAEHDLGWPGKAMVTDEQAFSVKVAEVRITAISHLFEKYPGLAVRYRWYQHRCKKWDIQAEWPYVNIEPKQKTVLMIR